MSSPDDVVQDACSRRQAPLPVALLMLLVLAIGLIGGGCGPTRTAGTRGIAKKDLAVLSIPQLPEKAYVRIETVTFDDNEETYPIGNGRKFYLPPGEHTAGFKLIAIRPDVDSAPKWIRWVIPGKKSIELPAPEKLPLGPMTAGKTYELAPPNLDSLGEFWREGSMSLVREKEK